MPVYVIDSFGTPANPVVDITGTPLSVLLNFEAKGASAPADNPLQASPSLLSLPPGLLNLLQTPLSQMGDQIWAQNTDSNGQTMRDRMRAQITSQVPSALQTLGSGFSPYNISVFLPATGDLRAVVLGVDVPGSTASQNVFLSYELAGISVNFAVTTPYTGGLISDPTYNLTFDVELLIQIVVPLSPGPITNTATIDLQNANIRASNLSAGVGDAILTVLDFLTGQPTKIFQSAEGDVDTSGAPAPNLGNLSNLLSQLSSAWQAASTSVGFTQLSAFIDVQRTLNFRFIHPVDPAPTVVNAASQVGSLFPAQLGTSASEVQAGGSLMVTGTDFPLGQASSLFITWNDTVSGLVTQSDITWGPANGPFVTFPQPRNGADHQNVFTAVNLVPNEPYTFSVRDEDLLTETPFSTPLTITTQPTDQVDLLLAPQGGGPQSVVGSATLDSSGAFTTPASIPPGLASGTYILSAELAGGILATTLIQVVAADELLPPFIEVINPATSASLNFVQEGTSFMLVGVGFQPGTVNVTIDSAGGLFLGTAVAAIQPGDSAASFQQPFPWPLGVTGTHSVVADEIVGGQTLEAAASLFIDSTPG